MIRRVHIPTMKPRLTTKPRRKPKPRAKTEGPYRKPLPVSPGSLAHQPHYRDDPNDHGDRTNLDRMAIQAAPGRQTQRRPNRPRQSSRPITAPPIPRPATNTEPKTTRDEVNLAPKRDQPMGRRRPTSNPPRAAPIREPRGEIRGEIARAMPTRGSTKNVRPSASPDQPADRLSGTRAKPTRLSCRVWSHQPRVPGLARRSDAPVDGRRVPFGIAYTKSH
jgi:hypothetical protein